MANGESPARGALSTFLLFVAAAALAIAIAVLAWIVFGRLDMLDAAHKEIKESVEKRLTKEHFDERIDRLERLLGLLGDCCPRGPREVPTETNPRIGLMFNNARLPAGREPSPDGLSEKSPGIALSHAQGEKLDKLADALVACAELDPINHPVHLKVQGYSSTLPFKRDGRVLRFSNQLNLAAANLRARVVTQRLADRRAHRGNGVHVERREWQSYPEIERPFQDAEGFDGADQEQLNRVVYIDLQDAGSCERKIS